MPVNDPLPAAVPRPRPPLPAGPPASVPATLAVEPWLDPVIDRLGHDPRSSYVERFWLAILGPSTVLLLRRLADQLDGRPEGFTLDLADTAHALGVGAHVGRGSTVMRTLDRSCRFGAARFVGPRALAVRRKLPPLTLKQAGHLPPSLRDEHQAWLEHAPRQPPAEELRRRARQLALSLLQLGEEVPAAERQLHRWRFHPALAHDAVRWAVAQQGGPVSGEGGA